MKKGSQLKGLLRCLWLAPAFLMLAPPAVRANRHPIPVSDSRPREYVVVGVVISADAGSSSIVIRGASLMGRLRIQVGSFRVKQPSSLEDLKPGDMITSVYSRSDGMLHRVRRVESRRKAARNTE